MRNFFLFIAISFCSTNLFAQKNCCSPSSTETFAMLGGKKKFSLSHEDPIPFELRNPIGKIISFKTPDGKEGKAYEINSQNTVHVIFVIHEWWGLNDYIKQEAEQIAKETGARVLALDLYDGKIATVKDSASSYMQQVKTERAEAIIKGALAHIGTKANVGTIGWCFGGGWSMQASLLAGKQARACVMYYGMPEENLNKLKNLNAPVLFVFAEKDQWINKKVLEKFEADMKEAGKSLEVKKYAADHAFANPSNPKFERNFADDAHKASMAFFKKHLIFK
jgi:carboxymethylenebutenolidase